MIRNLLVNPEGPVPQLVLEQSITMPTANGWEEELRLLGSLRWLRDAGGGKGMHHASGGERAISRVRYGVEWSLAMSFIGPGVANRRLEMQLR